MIETATYEDESKDEDDSLATNIRHPETPILPTYSRDAGAGKRGDRLRRLLMKENEVLQLIPVGLSLFTFAFRSERNTDSGKSTRFRSKLLRR
jgi:hypothetical protein